MFTESTFLLPATNTLPVPALNIIMGDIQVTEEEVYEVLSALDPTKSSGIDGIGYKLLKHCACALYAPICHLFNLTITKHSLPSEWKLHLITPIHKSGDRAQVNNYRPISLLCTVSKVLECNELNDFISERELISTNQFSFRKYHSTVQQLLLFLNKVTSYIDSNSRCDTIYLDFSKAFDSVPHNELWE